jgi:hypothetical protein
MTIKIRPDFELNRIKEAWEISNEGILMWISGYKKEKPVSLQTLKSGHQNCFLFLNGKSKGYSTGQISWYLYTGEWPMLEIDHIDGNPRNNKKENLRLATRSEQCRNRIAGKDGRKNKGVYKREYGNKWSAQIWINGICKNLGTYDSEEEASEVRELATIMFHGEFANIKSYKEIKWHQQA